MDVQFIVATPATTEVAVDDMEENNLYVIDLLLQGPGTIKVICGGSEQLGNTVAGLSEGQHTLQLRAADVETYRGVILEHTGTIELMDVAVYDCALTNPLAEIVKEV